MKLEQLKKIGKIVTSGALALGLCLSLNGSVLAAQNTNSDGAVVSDNETSVKAAITKVLEMGETTETPNATFTFHFEQQVGAAEMKDAKGTVIPVMQEAVPIKDHSVSVNGKTGTDNSSGKKIVEVETGNFLEKATDNANYQHAGIYVYKVTETADTYNITEVTKEKMTYSKAEYTVYVYVANKADGTGVYIKGVGVLLSKNDAGEVQNPGTGGKVDPTPNPDPNTNGEIDTDNSKMKFTNQYLKTNGGGGDPTVENNRALQISKTVAGDLGDHTKYFDFSVTVTRPAIDTTTAAYKGYVIDKTNNTVVTANENVADASVIKTDDAGRKYIEFDLTSGGTKVLAVKLKHNQELAFTDASVGTHFQAAEVQVTNYTPTLAVKVNNVTVTNGVTATDSGDKIVGEKRENSARFTNTYKDVTPTGIIMNNLSFVMMILVAVAAVAVTLVLRNKRRKLSA